jgi:L-alanine-DL-glutamate epimerase-like enolase superfamily enzyme
MRPPSPLRLSLRPLRIPFRTTFRHASAERSETSSLWAEARGDDNLVGYGESCPRPYVTGETIDTATAFFERHRHSLERTIADVATLNDWMAARTAEIDANPAAWCAIELALLDCLARVRGLTVEGLLGLEPLAPSFRYSAVLGDMGPLAFQALAHEYRRRGFDDFKLKLSGDLERDRAKMAALTRLPGPDPRLRADANNLWATADEAVTFIRALDMRLFALEEPLRARQYAALAAVGAALECRIVLDESCLAVGDIDLLPAPASRWIVNVRVSKMGGLLRALAVVGAARRAGLGVVVGAQVGETSLLTRVALTVATAAGDALVAQEGAFGTLLLARDVCDPPISFGEGGWLRTEDHPALTGPGFGLSELTPDEAEQRS